VGICLGLFGFVVLIGFCLDAYRDQQQRSSAESLRAAQAQAARSLERRKLRGSERFEAGTVLVVQGRTAVQVLESGRPVPCSGGYRLQ
jgi:hypothetical protein